MSKAWPRVPLGEVLTHRKQFVQIDDLKTYKRCRVRLHGQGVVLRDQVPGAEVKTKAQQLCATNELLVAEIDAKLGGFGIVPPDLDGAVVSSHYFLFVVSQTRLDTQFLGHFLRTKEFMDQVKARGSTNYSAIRPQHVLSYQIPLPPLPEQRRIVARIEGLAVQVEDARLLHQQSVEQIEALIPGATTSLLDDANWSSSVLGKILSERPRNWLGPHNEVESGGRGMLRINAVSSAATRLVDMTIVKHVELEEAVAEQFVVRNNDVFIVRYNGDINRVAKPAIYKGENESRVVYPDKLIRLRPDPARMTPDFLVFALSSRSFRIQIEEFGKTTAGNIGVSGGDVKSLLVPVPPLAEQCRIVAYLDELQGQVDEFIACQREVAAELDALLPTVLDKAFKGEL